MNGGRDAKAKETHGREKNVGFEEKKTRLEKEEEEEER